MKLNYRSFISFTSKCDNFYEANGGRHPGDFYLFGEADLFLCYLFSYFDLLVAPGDGDPYNRFFDLDKLARDLDGLS